MTELEKEKRIDLLVSFIDWGIGFPAFIKQVRKAIKELRILLEVKASVYDYGVIPDKFEEFFEGK